MKAKLIWMGISSILLIVGLGLIFFGLREINQAMASVRWLPVDGVIVSSDLNVETDSDGNTYYRANVRYAYGLDGQEFTGDRVYIGQTSATDRKPIFDLLLKYEKGVAVVVYYDPRTPTQAVLEPGLHGVNWTLPAIGSGFLVFGLVFSLIGWRVNFDGFG
jgi:hypothetical protein